jgi:hypothetical protein
VGRTLLSDAFNFDFGFFCGALAHESSERWLEQAFRPLHKKA